MQTLSPAPSSARGFTDTCFDGQYDVEVAYNIAQEYWGQGLATEGALGIRDYAFDKLRLVRLICLIDPENIASQRVAEKMGMTLEKTVDGFEGDNLPFYIFSINMQE